MSKVKLLLDVVEDLRSLADSVQAVADAMLQNESTVDAEPKTPAPAPKKELTLEEVRAVLGEKSRAGFTTEIQALLKKYGAPKLSGIMSTTAKPKPITSSPARAYTATTARSVPFTPVTRFSVTMAADTASATPGRMIWCSSRSLSNNENVIWQT